MSFIAVFLTLTLVLVACSPGAQPREYSLAESRAIAERYVRGSESYRLYEGSDLRLISYEPLRCLSCYRFTYRYDISPQRLQDVAFIEVSLQVVRGEVDNVVVTELPAVKEFTIAEVTDVLCERDSECETPPQYLIRSNCPYTSKCIENRCAVICPKF